MNMMGINKIAATLSKVQPYGSALNTSIYSQYTHIHAQRCRNEKMNTMEQILYLILQELRELKDHLGIGEEE